MKHLLSAFQALIALSAQLLALLLSCLQVCIGCLQLRLQGCLSLLSPGQRVLPVPQLALLTLDCKWSVGMECMGMQLPQLQRLAKKAGKLHWHTHIKPKFTNMQLLSASPFELQTSHFDGPTDIVGPHIPHKDSVMLGYY